MKRHKTARGILCLIIICIKSIRFLITHLRVFLFYNLLLVFCFFSLKFPTHPPPLWHSSVFSSMIIYLFISWGLSLKAGWWIFNSYGQCFYDPLAVHCAQITHGVQAAWFPTAKKQLIHNTEDENWFITLAWKEKYTFSEQNTMFNSFVTYRWCFSSFKHLIGGLEDVSSKGHEDADAKAK